MAYVITAVGAGGKTTYLRKRAEEYLRQGLRVVMTTTTHIWPPVDATSGLPVPETAQISGVSFFLENVQSQGNNLFPKNVQSAENTPFSEKDQNAGISFLQGEDQTIPGTSSQARSEEAAMRFPGAALNLPGKALVYAGKKEPSGKLSFPGEEAYEELCRIFDVVLAEGDGSHCMPVKIPGQTEPVIPEHTDEIVVVMGAHAVGRRLDVVCQRYARNPQLIYRMNLSDLDGRDDGADASEPQYVTEDMLRALARQFYIEPLQCRYPDARIHFELSRMPHCAGRTAGVIMASGFGRRYGGNKLLAPYCGKPLYRHTLEHVAAALGKENTIVVTQYPEIRDEVRSMGIDAVMNPSADEGICASIRIGTQRAIDMKADRVMFFAADMPDLPAEEIAMFARQFAGSGKWYGCMEFGEEHTATNPGAFRLDKAAEKLLQLTGDRGAMRIMKQEPWNIYSYQIAPEWARDIDTKEL